MHSQQTVVIQMSFTVCVCVCVCVAMCLSAVDAFSDTIDWYVLVVMATEAQEYVVCKLMTSQ